MPPVASLPLLHVSGTLATERTVQCVCMQPFDLVGARMMNQPVSATGLGLRYQSPVDCFAQTVKHEGLAGLYKGVGANYLRMGPQYILTFVFFEQLMKFSKNLKEK